MSDSLGFVVAVAATWVALGVVLSIVMDRAPGRALDLTALHGHPSARAPSALGPPVARPEP